MNCSQLVKTSFLFVSLVAAQALAGSGSGVGPSACSYATYVCSSEDGYTNLCIYPDNKVLVALSLANGGTFSTSYAVKGIAKIGDITTFEYSDLTLKLCYGIGEKDGKLPAYLTYDSAGLSNFPMSCIKNN